MASSGYGQKDSDLDGKADTELFGQTDGTGIGNVGDRLKVDAVFQASNNTTMPILSQALRYDDMNSGTGGVSRGTDINSTFTDIYRYDGSGVLVGFLVTFENEKDWDIRLTVDGNVIFTVDTDDLDDDEIYGYDFQEVAGMGLEHIGFSLAKNTIRWNVPQKAVISYSSYVLIEARKSSGGSKEFRGGLVTLTKET